jgi:serine/threonine protein kinase
MKAVGRLSHPNIVRATDAGEINGVHYLAMELIDGETLAEVVKKRGRPTLQEACRWIRQAALALHAAHETGLIHRDVKPGNFMLDRDGQIKVLDLGLARINSAAELDSNIDHFESDPRPKHHPLTWAGGVFGTAAYIAPEQEKDARQVDARADVFGLGGTRW